MEKLDISIPNFFCGGVAHIKYGPPDTHGESGQQGQSHQRFIPAMVSQERHSHIHSWSNKDTCMTEEELSES